MIPMGLAFGEMAGLPLVGLYAGILPLIAYASFGSSRQLIIGPDASMAALLAVSVAPVAGEDAGRLAVMASLLGVIDRDYSFGSPFYGGVLYNEIRSALYSQEKRPVIVGFMHGLAVVIAVGQLSKVLGVHGGGETPVVQIMAVC